MVTPLTSWIILGQVVPHWAIVLALLIFIAAATANAVWNIQQEEAKLSEVKQERREVEPHLEPHSISNDKTTLKINLKNTGAPLILKKLTVHRSESNFLPSWASPTQPDKKIGRKRLMRMEFAMYEEVKDYTEAAGAFELVFEDENQTQYEQKIRVNEGEIQVDTQKQIT
jgi:hypothetical protein